MKVKIDFITNSSSASFIIPKKYLTEKQIASIHSHIELGCVLSERNDIEMYYDAWRIRETKDEIGGDTSMDNFDMLWFLDQIGVDPNIIKYEHSNDTYYEDYN